MPLALLLCAGLLLVSSSANAQVAQILANLTLPCATYSGSICSSVVTYKPALLANISALDASITQSLAPLLPFRPAFQTCVDSLHVLACMKAYPQCSNQQAPASTVILPCQSVCETVRVACAAPFALLNQTLPSCDVLLQIDNPRQAGAKINVPYGSNATGCVNPPAATNTALFGAIESNSCAEPFIYSPTAALAGQKNPKITCIGTCCLPCPRVESLYPPQRYPYNTANMIFFGIRIVSALGIGFVFVSYCVLPGKRNHPALTVLFVSGCIFAWMLSGLVSFGYPKAVQCVSDFEESRMDTNIFCGVQGGALVLFTTGACVWTAYLIFNLHVQIVWGKSYLETYFMYFQVLTFGIPIALVIVAAVKNSLDYSWGATCLISSDIANYYFFYPLAALVYPAALLHLATFVQIARSAFKARNAPHNTSQISTASSTARESKRILQAFYLQWRAMALAVVFVATFTIYWLVAFLDVSLKAGSLADPTTSLSQKLEANPWLATFVKCIFTKQGFETCFTTYAESSLPSFTLHLVSDVAVNTVGLWIFFVFGARKVIFTEWRDVVFRRNHGSPSSQTSSNNKMGRKVTRNNSNGGGFEMNDKFDDNNVGWLGNARVQNAGVNYNNTGKPFGFDDDAGVLGKSAYNGSSAASISDGFSNTKYSVSQEGLTNGMPYNSATYNPAYPPSQPSSVSPPRWNAPGNQSTGMLSPGAKALQVSNVARPIVQTADVVSLAGSSTGGGNAPPPFGEDARRKMSVGTEASYTSGANQYGGYGGSAVGGYAGSAQGGYAGSAQGGYAGSGSGGGGYGGYDAGYGAGYEQAYRGGEQIQQYQYQQRQQQREKDQW
ncbi:hypothetical protein BJ742DRAFT_873763 [Cladochytrium replicatum]|nr:hypothetical protein BJ742DRAFT_873763 [Cladochytrium replicatum]